MKKHIVLPLVLLVAAVANGGNMVINSLSGPVTTNELNSFISFMAVQTPPTTPWGTFNATNGSHNLWADGTGGRELEAMGEVYEISTNVALLNQMISWADYCTSQRNDLMSVTNGGQRVMWTGLIDKVWVPDETNAPTPGYAGCENEDTEGHLALCAKLILQTPSLWYSTVPDGNPYGYGTTYLQRATNYLGKCDEANDEYSLKWFIQPGTSLIVAPTNAAWVAENENVNAINRQMMFLSGFQRLAEAHEILGDNPARVAQYDAICKAVLGQCTHGMTNFNTYTKNGQTVYDWGYYPTTDAPEATEIHAEYDIIGIYRGFNRTNYNLALGPLVPLANTMVNVIYLGTNTFAGDVAGGSGTQSPIYSGWLWSADWNPAVYTVVAGVSYTNGWYATSADIEAGILWMKNRRYLEFSVTPPPATNFLQAGASATLPVTVTPLGGFTNAVSLTLTGLPANSSASFSSPAINLAAVNFAATNVTLTITTSNTTPTGTYALSVIGTGGSVAHTNNFNLTVGNFGLNVSPAALTVLTGTNVSYTLTVATNSGFTGTVAFGLSGLPTNTGFSFTPASLAGAGSATLKITASNAAPAAVYPLTVTGTNGSSVAAAAVTLTIVSTNSALLTWNGGSAANSNWSDPNNWGGSLITSNDFLFFSGTVRLTNTNDTVGGTYSNLVFNAGAGAFTLAGNPLTLAGDITNNATATETVTLGLLFNNNPVFDGAGGPLIIGGGLTNTIGTAGYATLTLADTGFLTNLFNSASPGGTNIITLNSDTANWTLLNNAAATAITVPWVLSVNAGTLAFGNSGSAPNLTLTTPNNTPQDNLVGNATGGTGTFNMVNGTLTTAARFDTANQLNATGIVTQAGGTLNIGSQFQGANGSNPGEVSLVTLTGGTLNIAAGSGPFYLASRGAGTLTLSNSAVLNCGTLDLSRNANGNTIGSVGTVNLNGGTLAASHVGTATANSQAGPASAGPNPAATFNFNGGTLKITSGTTPFFQGSTVAPLIPIAAIVQSGGAYLNSNGNTNIFAEPLLHQSSLGATPDGGLTKTGAGCLILASNLTYTGGTTVNAGTLDLTNAVSLNTSPQITILTNATLDVTGRTNGQLTLVSGQTLSGGGTVKGTTLVSSNATLAPGNFTGTFAFGGSLTLSNGSATVLQLSKAPATNEVVQVATTLTYGGTLALTNVSLTPLAAGDTFRLFSAATYSGAFTSLSPAIPGLNLAWNTNSLATGTLSVVASPTPLPKVSLIAIQTTNLILNVTNGVPNWPGCLLAATNLAIPATNWTRLATNVFDAGGGLRFTNPYTANSAQMFYRVQLQ